MNIDQIKVGFRYRKDLGDVRALAESIEEVGLLHPVVVTPEGRLIAGQRRLAACRILEWNDVPVTVVDLYQAARGEALENFVRKDLLPSEIVALKRAVEPLEGGPRASGQPGRPLSSRHCGGMSGGRP
jgi:ParB family chromosome partitioning protein